MAAVRKYTVAVTSNGSGAATAYTPYLNGFVVSIEYLKTDYTDGVDFTITSEATGEGIWTEANVNAATVRYPRAATHGVDGAASLYAALGSAINDRIGLSRDRVKIVLAQAGATHTGTFVVTMSDR